MTEPAPITPEIMEVSAIESIEKAQVDIQISTARKYPRVLSKVKNDMLSFATLDEETAASCFYTVPRGNKNIQGESVRLAEIAASCYGNIKVASRVISVDTTSSHPHVVVQAVAHDLEKNVVFGAEKRRRITKKKSKDTIDDDDIQLACNAGSAIAFRDAIFKVVPKALIRPVFLKCKQVAVGDVKSLVEKRAQVLERLKAMGATEERILQVVDAAKVEDIDLTKMEILIGLGTALKDGEITLEDAFPFVVKEPSKPVFQKKAKGSEETAVAPEPATSEPTPTTPQPAPVDEAAALNKLTVGERLQIMADDDKVAIEDLPAALRRLNQLPPRSSINDWKMLPDEKLEWAEAHWNDVIKYLGAKS